MLSSRTTVKYFFVSCFIASVSWNVILITTLQTLPPPITTIFKTETIPSRNCLPQLEANPLDYGFCDEKVIEVPFKPNGPLFLLYDANVAKLVGNPSFITLEILGFLQHQNVTYEWNVALSSPMLPAFEFKISAGDKLYDVSVHSYRNGFRLSSIIPWNLVLGGDPNLPLSEISLVIEGIGQKLKEPIYLCKKIPRKIGHLGTNPSNLDFLGMCLSAISGPVEPNHLYQWISHHMMHGADHFIIYARENKWRKPLQNLIDKGIVSFHIFPLRSFHSRINIWADQVLLYNHCQLRYKKYFSWLGIWDLDEYIHSDKYILR
jgi:hypothetical protein